MAKENKPILRHLKGWKGWVWNYHKMMEAFDKVWDDIKWNEDPKNSGAKSVEKDEFNNKTIYKF